MGPDITLPSRAVVLRPITQMSTGPDGSALARWPGLHLQFPFFSLARIGICKGGKSYISSRRFFLLHIPVFDIRVNHLVR